MESAALFVVADALGCRCGSCFHVIWNQERELAGLDQNMSEDTSAAVRVAVDALRRIITQDRARAKKLTPPRRPDRAAQQGAISLKREPSEADRV